MTKDEMESAFRRGGKVPVAREKLGSFDLFISDGWSAPPHLTYQRHQAIQSDDFPLGMFVTSWWLGKDEKLFVGQDLFIDPSETSQSARINAARKDAQEFYTKLKRLH